MAHLKNQSRSAFEASARSAHGGRVRSGVGAVGSTGSASSVRFGSNRIHGKTTTDKTGGFKQKPRLSSSQTIDNSGS